MDAVLDFVCGLVIGLSYLTLAIVSVLYMPQMLTMFLIVFFQRA